MTRILDPTLRQEATAVALTRAARPRSLSGVTIGMHTFGASAPLKELQEKFGFTPEKIVAAAKAQIGR